MSRRPGRWADNPNLSCAGLSRLEVRLMSHLDLVPGSLGCGQSRMRPAMRPVQVAWMNPGGMAGHLRVTWIYRGRARVSKIDGWSWTGVGSGGWPDRLRPAWTQGRAQEPELNGQIMSRSRWTGGSVPSHLDLGQSRMAKIFGPNCLRGCELDEKRAVSHSWPRGCGGTR